MTPTGRPLSLLLLASLVLMLSLLPAPIDARKKMLIYTYTEGFHHESIPTATKAVQQLAKNANPPIDTVHSDDPNDFEPPNYLNQFDMLMFISVSGAALSDNGSENLRKYIQAGGGFLGAHEACDALYNHTWYGRLVGAYFNYHPEITNATLNVVNRNHPSTAHLNATWRVYDEMYNFNSNPSSWGKQYVLTADQSSYNDPVESIAQRASEQGSPHPIAWWKEGNQLTYNPHVKVGGGTDPTRAEIRSGTAGNGGPGRSFYTALGHTDDMWLDPTFQQHIMGAVSWLMDSPVLRSSSANPAAGAVGSDFDPTLGPSTASTNTTNSTSATDATTTVVSSFSKSAMTADSAASASVRASILAVFGTVVAWLLVLSHYD